MTPPVATPTIAGMSTPLDQESVMAGELSNRLFFRLYQCANLVHKTGTKALERYGITTQQWAVLGALSRSSVTEGMTMGELAQFLRVSRQNLSGVVTRLEAVGYVERVKDTADQRSRRVRLSAKGRPLWTEKLMPMIADYYAQVLTNFSIHDQIETLHYLNKLFENLKRVDTPDDAG